MPDTPPAIAGRAVFVSYAREDTASAQRIAEALRSHGVEVWFDQSELRGGDAWDNKIRTQIKECALFMPVISDSTQARHEGYFRLEWRLADQRTHLMGKSKAFIVPVCIDATRDSGADVPDSFLAVQWTRLANGEANHTFCERVKALLAAPSDSSRTRFVQHDEATRPPDEGVASPAHAQVGRPRRGRLVWLAGTTVAFALLGALGWKFLHRDAATVQPPEAARRSAPPTPEKSAAPLSEARQLVAKAWAAMESTPEAHRANLDLAADFCQRAAALDPTDADVWAAWSQVDTWAVALVYDTSAARREAARTKAAKALALAPRSYEARLAQACYLVRGEGFEVVSAFSAEAEPQLRELLQEKPDEPRALLALGHFLRNRKRPEESLQIFDLLALNPNRTWVATAYNAKGYLLSYDARRWDEALLAAERSVAAQPFFSNVTLLINLALNWQGDLDLAKATLERMPAADLLEDFGTQGAILVWYYRRDSKQLLRVLSAVPHDWLESNYFNGPKDYWVGVAHQLAGSTAAAHLAWRSALKLVEQRLVAESSSALLQYWKGELLALLGERPAAEQAYALAKQLGSAGGPTKGRLLIVDQAESISKLKNRRWAELRFNPSYDPLRDHPAFQALLAAAEKNPKLSPHARAASSVGAPAVAPNSSAGLLPTADQKSVAVLAFANLSDDKSNEYFSDGISEELLNVLAKVPGLKVSARTSAFHFKGMNTAIPEIAQQLGVAYVVEGSVRKQGTQVRITAQLIKAADGFHVWSDTFTRELKDIFAVQDEIAGLIAKNLSLKLGVSSAAATASVNPEAFELYLQAKHELHARTMAGCDQAEAWLTKAIQLEPKFARAHALLAETWGLRNLVENKFPGFTHEHDWPDGQRIIAKAHEALKMDPNCGDAHTALGTALWWSWRRAEAERELQIAIVLNPNDADAHRFLGFVLRDDGRMSEALAAQQRAVELEPLRPVFLDSLGRDLYLAGQPTKALAVFNRALAIAPDYGPALSHAPHALLDLGRKDEALALARRLPDNNRARQYQVGIFARAGANAEAERLLARTEGDRARLLLALGHTEEALECLDPKTEAAITLHDWLFERWADPVRADPRFKKFIETIGATEAHARAQAWRKAHPPEMQVAK